MGRMSNSFWTTCSDLWSAIPTVWQIRTAPNRFALILVLGLALLASPSFAQMPHKPGDFNDDGCIDNADLAEVI